MVLDTAMGALLISIIVALLGGSVAYGILTNKVNNHEKAIDKLEKSFITIDNKLDEICAAVSGIKATLVEKDRENK